MQHKKTDCYLPKLAIYFYRCYATRYRKLTADLGLTLRGLEHPGLTGKRFFYISFSTSGGEITTYMNCYCVIHLINMFCIFLLDYYMHCNELTIIVKD